MKLPIIEWKLLQNIVIVVLLRRLLLFFVGMFADVFIKFEPSYPYYESLLQPFGPAWFVKWGGFDGVHYLTIAHKGYLGTGLIQAFFPLYPMLLRAVNFSFSPVFSGLLLSTLCFIGAMYVWVLLMRQKNVQIPWWMMIMPWFVFPTSFYFGAIYTESLFMFLVFLCLFFLHKKNMFIASIFAGLASATRIVGVMLVPMIMLQIFLDWWPKRSQLTFPMKKISVSLIGILGLFSYMVYLRRTFQDALYFLHVQEEFGAGRSDRFILLPQVIYRYINIFWSQFSLHNSFQDLLSWSYYAYAQEFVITLLVFVILVYFTYKHWKKMLPELVFSWGAFIMPTLTGTLQSMPRYVLAIFPLFVSWNILGKSKPVVYWVLCGVSICFMLLNVILFLQGRWVA